LKSLDGFFEWTDSRRAANLEEREMKQAIYLERNRLAREMKGTHYEEESNHTYGSSLKDTCLAHNGFNSVALQSWRS
jgi:hypothetical protein